jgi:hypothetical protein
MNWKLSVISLFVAAALGLPAGDAAFAGDLRDFPVRPLDKTFVMDERQVPGEMESLGGFPRASVRVVLKGNNMIADSLLDALNSVPFEKVSIVVTGVLKAHQVAQLKRIERLKIIYTTAGPIEPGTARMLQAFGPVRKEIVISGPLTSLFLKSVSGLKGLDLTLDRRKAPLDPEEIRALGATRGRASVIIGEDFFSENLKLIGGNRRIFVTLVLKDGQLEYEIALKLADLGNRLTIGIPDSAGAEAYKSVFEAPQFSLEIRSVGKKFNPKMLGFLRTTDP